MGWGELKRSIDPNAINAAMRIRKTALANPQHLDIPGAARESVVLGEAPRSGVGEAARSDGNGVRAHVQSIRQQRHGIEPPTANDFDDDHRQGDKSCVCMAALWPSDL